MGNPLMVMHWVAALIVLAESLNKLERCDPLQPGLEPRARLLAVLKAVAWILMALGAGGAVVRPALVSSMHTPLGTLLLPDRPGVLDLMYTLGFAVLIVRERVKER